MVLHKNNSLITLSFITITILSGLSLSSSSSSATSASTSTATVKVAASCTLTTTGGGNYSAIVPNGTSAEISGSTMSVSCNDAGGFALYAVGYSNDTVGNNNMIGSSTNIPTNTSGTNSYWAMKINPTSGNTPTIENSFNNYHIIPDSHTKIASYSSSTGTGSLSVNATYKANISSTQLAGNYLGKVKYTLVHPANEIMPHEVACQANKICYNANTNIVEGQMGKQTPYSFELTEGIALYAPNFKRDGYGFIGWSDKYDYETNPDARFYGPQETIDAPSNLSTNGLSLYAMWVPSAGSIQSDTAAICNGLTQSGPNIDKTLNNVSALTDDRDNKTYAIAKLADGNCWMIENLKLDDSPKLSLLNTNNPSLPLVNNYSTNLTSNHLSPTTDPTQTTWCKNTDNECISQSMLATNNTVSFNGNTSTNYNPRNEVYSYGNYYNWYSATAGQSQYAEAFATGDICPAGWHLPTGYYSDSESRMLDVALGGNGNASNTSTTPTGAEMSRIYRSYPNNFIYSGEVEGTSISNRDSYGNYWSSVPQGRKTTAFALVLSESLAYPGDAIETTYEGMSIRCLSDGNNQN